MTRWIVGVGVLVGGIILVGALWGLILPATHTATASRIVKGTPDVVWNVITDVAGFPDWRPDVDSVAHLPPGESGPSWREVGPQGALGFVVTDREPPTRLVTRILDEGQPFGGSWTFELERTDGGTLVRLREDGRIHNPVFRVISRYLIGYDGTMRRYLDALAAHMERLG